jgi:hypothetical protein
VPKRKTNAWRLSFCQANGCQMVCFRTKNPNLGICIVEGLGIENAVLLKTIWNILRSFGALYDRLVQFVVMWHIYPVLVCLDQENLATPA